MIGVSCIEGAAGRIEICVSGEWRAVCDDYWWGNKDATIVCHQLGFNTQGMSYSHSMFEIYDCMHTTIEINHCGQSCFGRNENLKGIRDLKCGMVRSKLTDCEYNITNEESCTEEAGVMCSK